MNDIKTIFQNRKLCSEKLIPFGFSKKEKIYVYLTNIFNEQFQMNVTITEGEENFVNVIDNGSKEEYVLHLVPSAQGAFVGTVREEYENVLRLIAEYCFEIEIFKTEDAKSIIRYVRKKYNDELEFLWKKFPDYAIFRRKDNNKWYGLILTVKKNKLGLKGAEELEIFDMRMEPEELEKIVDGNKYFRGYHMNKKHWCTICLDGFVPMKEIEKYIDKSYALAAKK